MPEPERTPSDQPPSDQTRRDHLTFALRVHRALSGDQANACFSPYSVASALGLVARAARGQTADELAGLLTGSGVDTAGEDQLDASLAAQAGLLRAGARLRVPDSVKQPPVLAVANTLWAWDALPVEPDFQAEVARWPGGKVAEAPFVTDPEAARGLINADVAETTRDLIPELLPPGSVAADTVASVVNALYLRTAWANPFKDKRTETADFHAPGGARPVPMMHLSERVGYTAGEGWQVAGLPAVGGVQALILLPEGELAQREAELDAELITELAAAATPGPTVHLSMPRFALDVRGDLTGALRALGVRSMFGAGADLGGLSADPRLQISDVLHQAVLKVDEQGLEGAAATAAMVRLTSASAGPEVTMEVNRPFLVLVREVRSGVVYFLARVVEP